jgi:hypothetical protein
METASPLEAPETRMCHSPADPPRRLDAVAAFATALVAAFGAIATVAGAPLPEPPAALVAAAVASRAASR